MSKFGGFAGMWSGFFLRWSSAVDRTLKSNDSGQGLHSAVEAGHCPEE